MRSIRGFYSIMSYQCSYKSSKNGKTYEELYGIQRATTIRQLMSQNRKGKKKPPRTLEHRSNIGMAHKGMKHTEETKMRISKSKKGIPNLKLRGFSPSLETRKKLSDARKGKTYEEFYGEEKALLMKIKIRDRMIANPNLPQEYHPTSETKEKIRIARKGKTYSQIFGERADSVRRNLSLGLKGHYSPLKGKTYEQIFGLERGELQRTINSMSHMIDGSSFEPYPPTFNNQIKDRIRVRDNFKCQLCGVPELECCERLSVHHINYDKKDTSISNLVSLCRGCNSKVNKDRDKWKELFSRQLKLASDGRYIVPEGLTNVVVIEDSIV